MYEVEVYRLAETATLYYGKHFLSKGYEEKKKHSGRDVTTAAMVKFIKNNIHKLEPAEQHSLSPYLHRHNARRM